MQGCKGTVHLLLTHFLGVPCRLRCFPRPPVNASSEVLQALKTPPGSRLFGTSADGTGRFLGLRYLAPLTTATGQDWSRALGDRPIHPLLTFRVVTWSEKTVCGVHTTSGPSKGTEGATGSPGKRSPA